MEAQAWKASRPRRRKRSVEQEIIKDKFILRVKETSVTLSVLAVSFLLDVVSGHFGHDLDDDGIREQLDQGRIGGDLLQQALFLGACKQ